MDEIIEATLLEYCSSGFTSLTPLIGDAVSKSTAYRCKDELVQAGLIESNAKDSYRTTPNGLLRLATLKGEAPTGLTVIYPPLVHVPTPQHKAVIELTSAAIIARRSNLRPDHHPTIIIADDPLAWKTSTGIFLCHMHNLNPNVQVVNLTAESGRSLWLRKTSTGAVVYKRELLDSPLVVFDEFQSADADSKRLLRIWMDGRKEVSVENEKVKIEAVPMLTLNPTKGENLHERLGISEAQLRRSIVCDLTGIKIPHLAVKGEDILVAAKNQQPINITKPRHDIMKYKPKLYELFTATLNEEGQRLADLEMLTMLSTAMTAYFDPIEAIRTVFYDALLLFETIGWTRPGWAVHVKKFPATTGQILTMTQPEPTKTIPNETWVEAFKFLDGGGAATELPGKYHLSPDEALVIVKKYGELKNADSRKPSIPTSPVDPDVQQMEKAVKLADLNRQKEEHEKPFEIDRRIGHIEATLQRHGRHRQENCLHFQGNYCLEWWFTEKPNVSYQIGEPLLHTDGRWRIHPTFERCATCPAYQQRGTRTQDDISRTVTQLDEAARDFGQARKNHCGHLVAGFCRNWHWPQKPNVSYQVGEPLQVKDRWYINPSPAACAACPAYQQRGTPSIPQINAEVKLLRRDVDATPLKDLRNKFKCSSCGATALVAANVKCTKCGNERWWGWHPKD